jgi:acyl-CoA synthetase (AMP-forming)/AMP-acid ligase II
VARQVRAQPQARAPPDSYANTNAAEDIAQSVAYCFVEPERLKKGDGKHDPGVPEFGPLPRTSTGKVQRFVLREQEWTGQATRVGTT